MYEHIRHESKKNSTWEDRAGVDKTPYFDMANDTRIVSFVGQTTLLHCTVRDIGDRRVSNEKPSLTTILLIHVQGFLC